MFPLSKGYTIKLRFSGLLWYKGFKQIHMSMVGCSRDPSAEKYKLYHFVFQITSIDCSVRKVTCHQLSHWPAGKLLPVTPQCAETNGGAQARCVTIGDVTQFPQGVCLTEQVSWSAEMGRGSSMKGLNVGVGSSLPKMTTSRPACICQDLIDSSYLLQNCRDQTQSMPPSLMPKISIFCTFSLGHRRKDAP